MTPGLDQRRLLSTVTLTATGSTRHHTSRRAGATARDNLREPRAQSYQSPGTGVALLSCFPSHPCGARMGRTPYFSAISRQNSPTTASLPRSQFPSTVPVHPRWPGQARIAREESLSYILIWRC